MVWGLGMGLGAGMGMCMGPGHGYGMGMGMGTYHNGMNAEFRLKVSSLVSRCTQRRMKKTRSHISPRPQKPANMATRSTGGAQPSFGAINIKPNTNQAGMNTIG